MNKELGKLLKKQISLTEWLRLLDVDYADKFSKEDVDKRKTLARLSEVIGLPVEGNVSFEAVDIRDLSSDFQDFLSSNQDSLYAMRLLPKKSGLEKLRTRGLNLRELMDWFERQDINHEDYEVNLIDHPEDYGWATIFFVNKSGIHGEMVYGGHHLLTQGFHGDNKPLNFSYSFKADKWVISEDNEGALSYIQDLTQMLKIDDSETREELKLKFGAKFFNNYLAGYFETTDSSLGIWFIDYNQTLGDILNEVNIFDDLQSNNSDSLNLKGRVGSEGEVRGIVRIVEDPLDSNFQAGEILVCRFTSPDYLSLMKKAGGIITDEGGILSHAAIVARELGVPCVVATGNATSLLKTGQIVKIVENGNIMISS